MKGTEGLAATTQAAASAALPQAAAPLPKTPIGTGPRPEPVLPREQAVSAGPPQQQHQPAAAPASADVAAASAPRGPSQAHVIKNYDPPSEPENGYLGVVEGTMVTVLPGSRAAPEARNRFQCDYVFAWQTDQQEKQGWVPVDILDNMPA